MLRTHLCAELSEKHIGQVVEVCGGGGGGGGGGEILFLGSYLYEYLESLETSRIT